MKVAVIQFPGSNCDRDCLVALTKAGLKAELVWHQKTSLSGFGAIVLPGGFSYGDYLRPGAMASKSNIMPEVTKRAGKGYPVLGICNGFQILTEAKLLPGALLRNQSLRFVCKPQTILVASDRTPFTKGMALRNLCMPVAHMDGGYYINETGLQGLHDNDQIVFTYLDNPNGSVSDIAGVCNIEGNVVGLMPHPERTSDPVLGSEQGLEIFQALI